MDGLRTANGVEFIPGSGKQGGFWASAVGGLLIGGLGGYLMGGGSANRNAILRDRFGSMPVSSFVPEPFGGHFVEHTHHGVSRFDLEQSEKIGRLEGEIIKRDSVIGDLAAVEKSREYTNQYVSRELAEMRAFIESNYVKQPKVHIGYTGAEFCPGCPTACTD